MCGIIGVLNSLEAEKQVGTALTILQNRGKDASNMLIINDTTVIGHTLHSVINHVPQPIKGIKGSLLTANCEIYNWQELNEKYELQAENDAKLLLKFLDKFGLEDFKKLEELDGVFAFAYLRDGILYLVRDLFGVKPLWFTYNREVFVFASEKKVLEKLNYLDIQELNPRSILKYNLEQKNVEFVKRDFVTFLPEHRDSFEMIKQKTSELLNQAIAKRIPDKKFGLLFSGGIDSTFLAKYFKDQGKEFTCYTAVLDTENKEPSDLIYAQKVAEELGLKLKIKKIKQEEIPAYLEKIVPLIEDSNVVKVGVALTFYLACEMAREDRCKVIFSGLGSEEIFAGYERHKNSFNINQECVSGLLKMYERDLYRDDVLTMDNNLELRLPFLDRTLAEYALKIPEIYKIQTIDKSGEVATKFILREISKEKGISEEFSFRKKTAAQYGSKFDHALGKLAKQEGFSSKSAYLKTFYPTHNLKLGILFSSGKDSAYAAYIMQKQNYNLTCLITMRSKNQDSYMFHTPAINLVEMQAEAMNLPIIIKETKGEKELELEDLEEVLQEAKERHKIDGVVTGAVYSTYQRDRIEKICDKLGLKIFSPLWHKDQEQEMEELLKLGFKIVFSSIAGEGLDETWIGKEFGKKELEKLKQLNEKIGFHINGEGGEYESLVLDCPLFTKKIELIKSKKVMDSKISGRLIIEEAKLVSKS